MEKTAIYIAMHKPYLAPEDPVYIPIQVGAALKDSFCELKDNLGEHISEKNPAFCELTALYWAWKNSSAEIIGLVHYRRHFAGRFWPVNPWKRIITGEEIQEHLRYADILLPKTRNYMIETNYTQYAHAHYEKDLQLCRQVLTEQSPGSVLAFDRVMQRRRGHRFNMMIAKRDVLDRYCQWLFPILFTLEERIDTSGYSAYDRRVIGFLAERLLDVWLETAGVLYFELPVVSMERENWLRKGSRFLLRKARGSLGLTKQQKE